MLFIILLFASVCSEEKKYYWTPAIEGGVDGKLLQVHIVYRHGHREPRAFYPRDPHASSPIWKNGPSQLTILGRQQSYQFGQNLRTRYQSLLPKERAWKTVKASSSDTVRTLMSSSVVLAGLIPPNSEDIWSNITWQPAAIHTTPSDFDNVLVSHPHCPEYDYLLNQLPNVNDTETKLLYNLLTKYTGKQIASSKTLLNLYTCLEIEAQAGLRLPNWTQKIYKTMEKQAANALLRSTQTLELKRLRSGPLLKKLINFKKYNSTYNIHLYCTHDTVVGSLLGSLGFELTEPPNFTSAFMVEYREVDGEIHAQFWYSRGPDGELTRLRLPGCGIRCPFTELSKLVEPLIPRDWTEDCTMLEYKRYLVSQLRFVFAISVLIVLIGWCIISKNNKESYEVL
ncbi:unnamed protein product [Parnassius apollo]|uniref:acid phosphatase n=1 Tax=Parnassius apollo TaxID=110799 RepID=A0A8S3WLV4_PARAO|nr:unnamed protein product [Parnassius apollo]